MRFCTIASNALLLMFCTGGQAVALTEAEREDFRPIEVKCPASNKGKFEQLSQNLLGESERIIWQFDGKETAFLTMSVKDVTGPWSTWLSVSPGSRDYYFIASSKLPSILQEACDDKGVRRAFAVKVQASRKVLRLPLLKQMP